MANLTGKQKSFLRGKAHALSAIVQVGKNGITQIAVDEIKRCLADHELIKVKIDVEDQESFQAAIQTLDAEVGAALVQTIGHTAVFYAPAKEPKIKLPQ